MPVSFKKKHLKRFVIILAVLMAVVTGAVLSANYFIKQSGITYDSFQFEFPATLTLTNLKFDSEDVLITAKYAHVSWHWRAFFRGGISGEVLEANDLLIQLKPGDPNDTSTFEFSDIPYIQFDTVRGTNIRYVDKDGLDSMIIDLPTVYAQNFSLNKGIFTDSITANNGTFIMSFPDTTESDDTTSAMADLMHINPKILVLTNAHLQFNFPDEQYDAKEVAISLNGRNTDNPIDLKLNNLSLLFQDSIALSSHGEAFYITQAGDMEVEKFLLSSPQFDISVNEAAMTADNRYYASINQTHINSGVVQLYVDSFPIVAETDMVFDGGVYWGHDSLIFEQFSIVLDKETKTLLDGFALIGDSLEQTDMAILTFQSTLYELQRLFELDSIENQEDVTINAHFAVNGNLSRLTATGAADLNRNKMILDASYAKTPNEGMDIGLVLKSAYLNPQQVVTAAPEDFWLGDIHLAARSQLDSNNQIRDLTAKITCKKLNYSDYKLDYISLGAAMNPALTVLTLDAEEQNLCFDIQTEDDVLNSDSIHYYGNFSSDIPTLTGSEANAGNAQSPFEGNFILTENALLFDILLDSLLFASDSLENDYLDRIAFSYASDSTEGIKLLLQVDSQSVFTFEGEARTFEWMSNPDEMDTTNFPYFDALLTLNIDSNLVKVFTGKPGSIDVSNLEISMAENMVDVELSSSLVMYNGYRIEGTALSFFTNFDTYRGNLVVDSLKNPYIDAHDLNIKVTTTEPDQTESAIYFMLTDFDESVDFGLLFIDSNETKTIKFQDEHTIKFGMQKWELSENEGATFDKEWNLLKSHFIAANDSQQIAVTTKNEIIDVDISGFNVGPLYTVLTGDSIVKGKFNLQMEYRVTEEALTWNGSLNNIEIDTIPVGDFTTKGTLRQDELTSHQELKHDERDLTFDLNKTKDEPANYAIDLKKFDVGSMNPLYNQWIFNGSLSGTVDGKLKGQISEQPTAEGFLNLNSVVAQIDDYGLYLAIPDSRLDIKDDEMAFQNFEIKDKKGNPLLLNGYIPLSESRPIKLHAKANHFKLLEQPDKRKKYWGNVDISTNLNISGKYDNLTISGFLNTLESSSIGYKYSSQTEANALEDEIEFTTFSDTALPEEEIIEVAKIGRIHWDVKINMGKTKVYILLSETSNDFVRMTVDGALKLKTGQGRVPKFYGKMESKKGSVFYDAPMVSDLNLKIEYASIKYRGDPDNPIISFSGTEKFRVSTNEIPGNKNGKGTMVPVLVVVSVKESPLKEFELKFDLKSSNGEMGSFIDGLPATTRETYAMNLLVFGTLTRSDKGGNSAMRAVVSKLNEISRRNIQSADLSFYMDTDKNVGINNMQGVKSIGYDFSKDFFHDKVKVSVGGEVVLQSSVSDGRKQFNPLGNVEIDYQIKEDPDIKIFALKKDSYLGPVDGQVDQYGVGISFSKWFKNLFHKSKTKAEE